MYTNPSTTPLPLFYWPQWRWPPCWSRRGGRRKLIRWSRFVANRCQVSGVRFQVSDRNLRIHSFTDTLHLKPDTWRNYANTLERLALRRSNVVEESSLHFDCGHHALSRHRRKYSHLQRRQRRAASPASLQESGSAGIRERGTETAQCH